MEPKTGGEYTDEEREAMADLPGGEYTREEIEAMADAQDDRERDDRELFYWSVFGDGV